MLLRALIDATTRIFMIAIAIYLAMRWLEVPAKLDRIIGTAILVIVWWQVGLWLTAAVTHLIDVRRGHDLAAAEGAASLNILRFVGVLLVWVVAFLMLLANLGVKIMPLVAGLGVGGIAIALAVQNVLGDLFASLSIALDKPFRVGEFTRDRRRERHGGADRDQEHAPSVGDRRADRHVEQRHPEEPRAELQPIPAGAARGAAASHRLRDAAAADRASCRRSSSRRSAPRRTCASSARISPATATTRCCSRRSMSWRTANYTAFMDAQQSINLRLLDEFARRGITLAYPTSRSMSIPASPVPAAPADPA